MVKNPKSPFVRTSVAGQADGVRLDDFSGKPVIAILNTWSDLQQCHGHFRERAEDVKRGVWQAGGFPVEMPVLSLSEMFVKPTAMFYRNLLSIEVEEIAAVASRSTAWS